jgi:malic enzyme
VSPIPQIQIHQTYAILAFKADPATMEIEQPQATIEMTTKQAKMHIQQENGELRVDQSRAWDAVGSGGVLAMNKRVADQMFGIAVEAIAKMVEDGNRMANLKNKQDSIPHIAWDNAFQQLLVIEYYGEASYLNVDEEYIPSPVTIEPELGEVNWRATPNRPNIQSTRGKFNSYLAQRNSIEITLPTMDKRL